MIERVFERHSLHTEAEEVVESQPTRACRPRDDVAGRDDRSRRWPGSFRVHSCAWRS